MAQSSYHYKVRSRTGQVHQGVMTGASKASVAQRLQSQGYTVLSVEKPQRPSLLATLTEPRGKIPATTLAVFCRQLAVMLASGMSTVDAMRITGELAKDVRLKRGLAAVQQDVLSGSGLSAAMAEHPRAFPPMMVHMIEAGEVTGALTEIVERLATYYEREAETRAKIKEALTYPTIVAIVAAVAVTILVFFVLPNFVSLFASMNMQLPWATQLILDFSTFLLNWWWALVGGGLVVIIAVRQWLVSPKGNAMKDAFLLRAPLLGPAVSKFVFSRMSRSLSLLLRSGVPMVEALRIVEKLIMNVPVAHALTHVRAGVERGASLSAALSKEAVFPRMLVQMAQVGEESGSIDATLEHLADFYEQEANYAVKSLTTMIEPIVIAGMAGVVVFLALAVVMPMFQMSTTVPGS